MPDHIHGIIQINDPVGADPCVCPFQDPCVRPFQDPCVRPGFGVIPIPKIVQWFKTMTTNDYIHGVKSGMYPQFDTRLWQRNYWERVIRNERELQNVRKYITDNPKNWTPDLIP